MLATGENLMLEPAGELQALLADYEMFTANGGVIGEGVLPPLGVEPLDGQIAPELPLIDDADILVPDPDPVIVQPSPEAPTAVAPPEPAPPAIPPMDGTDPAAPTTDGTTDTPPDVVTDPMPMTDPVVTTSLGSMVEGGAGENRFDIQGMSVHVEDLARILDFTQGEDTLHFAGAPQANAENFVATTADTYEDALLNAIRLIEGGQADYVAVQVADDVIVFGDNGNDVVEAAVVLAGRRVTDVSIFDVT